MIPPNPRSNDPLTPEQNAMLGESISDRHAVLDAMNQVIEKDEKELSAQTVAIEHLEATIFFAETALTTHKGTLSSLVRLQENLESLQADDYEHNWTTPSEVDHRCETTFVDVSTQLRLGAAGLTDSISRLKEYLPRLSISIQEMNDEVSSRRFMRDALSKYISDTRKHKDATERDVEIFRSLFKKVRLIPAEIWAQIFSLRVRAELVDFFASPENKRMPITAMGLSHVCRFWRGVVLSQRGLWYFVPVSAGGSRRLSHREIFRHFLSSGDKRATLVVNESEPRYNASYEVGPDDASTLEAYSLYVITKGYNIWNQPSSTPFRQPKSLQLQFLIPVNLRGFNIILGNFSMFSSLEIIFKDHYQPIELDLTAIGHQLTCLKIDMTTFQPFDLTSYLSPNLQELHLRHDGVSLTSPGPTTLRLSQLRVLGITPPDTSFTHSLDLPALKKAILYGPRSSDISILSLIHFGDSPNFKRVQELELRNWPLFQPSGGNQWNIITPIRDIVDNMRSIVSLRCVDSVISGTGLVELVTALKDTANAPGGKLERVTIDCCTGITRDQCDAVGQMVQKLEVYV